MVRSLLALFIVSSYVSVSLSQEWVRFRGPNGTGQSEATSIPGNVTEADYNWKVKLPGIGHSSPVIWGDKVFLLSADPQSATRYVLCLSAKDGKPVWTREFPGVTHHLHTRSSYASCTPTVDGEQVYAAWSDPEHTYLKAFSIDGKDVWSVDLGPWVSQHGYGTSPIVIDDLVVVTVSQEPSKQPNTPDPYHSFVVAVDRKSGQIRWKTPRKIDTTSYSVPCIYKTASGETQIICNSTAEGMFALDPKTGKDLWAVPAFKLRTVSSPYQVGDFLMGSTGSGGGGNYVVAIQPGAEPKEVYRVEKAAAPYVPTSVNRGDLLFLWSDKGLVTCVSAKDGAQIWQQRVSGNVSGSPVRVADKIYCMDDDGELVVLSATKEFKELGRHKLGEASRSTPAVSGGRMYLRTYSHLISIGGKAT